MQNADNTSEERPAPQEAITAPPVELAPTALSERIEVLDILRGFALFGVLLVNIEGFIAPSYAELFDLRGSATLIDQLSEWAIYFFASCKFFSLFSFLFGYGMALQMSRAAARGRRFVPFFARRLFVLLLFGVFHAVLLWCGDILVTYALLGLVLLLFRKRKDRTILISAFFLLFLSPLVVSVVVGLIHVAQQVPEVAAELRAEAVHSEYLEEMMAIQALEVHPHGTLRDILALRVRDVSYMAPAILIVWPNILAMFLFGVYAGRHKILAEPHAHQKLLKRLAFVGLIVGVPANLLLVVLGESVEGYDLTWLVVAVLAVMGIAAPTLAAVYASLLTLLVQRPRWRLRLAPLAAVGRTALTNYIAQSVIMTTLVSSYGLGWYGRIRPPIAILLTIAVFSCQLGISSWWLRRFRFGPAEWLWRSLTYRHWQPIGKPGAAPHGTPQTAQ